MHLQIDFASTVFIYDLLAYNFLGKSILYSFSWQKDQIPYQRLINNLIVGTQIWKEIFLILYKHIHE